jgi:hypothetical protein
VPRRPSSAIGDKRRRARRRDRGDTDDYQDDEDDGGGDSYRDDEDDGYDVDSFHPRKYPRHLTYPETSQLSHHPQAYALVPLLSQSQQTFSQPPSFNTGCGGGGWDQQLSRLPPLYDGGNASHHTAPVGGWMPLATQFPSQQQQHQQQSFVPCLPPSMPLGREYAAAPAPPSFGGIQQSRLYHSHREQQPQQQQRHFAGPPPNITFDAEAQAEFTSHNRIYAPLPLLYDQQQMAQQIQQQQQQQQQRQQYSSAAASASSAQYQAAGMYGQPQYVGQQRPLSSLSMLQPPPAVAPRQYVQSQQAQQAHNQHHQLQPQQQQPQIAHSQQQFQPAQQQLVPLSADSASVSTVMAPLSRDLLSKAAATSVAMAPALTAASITSALRSTASPLSSRSSASSRSSSFASEGGSNSIPGAQKKKHRRDVHLLHRDFVLHERLVTRDNHQFGHHSVYSWAADETVATVEESTRVAHKIRKVKQTFLEDHERSGGREGEVASKRRLNQQVSRIARNSVAGRSAFGGFSCKPVCRCFSGLTIPLRFAVHGVDLLLACACAPLSSMSNHLKKSTKTKTEVTD